MLYEIERFWVFIPGISLLSQRFHRSSPMYLEIKAISVTNYNIRDCSTKLNILKVDFEKTLIYRLDGHLWEIEYSSRKIKQNPTNAESISALPQEVHDCLYMSQIKPYLQIQTHSTSSIISRKQGGKENIFTWGMYLIRVIHTWIELH